MPETLSLPATSVCPKHLLHEHVLTSKFVLAIFTVLAPAVDTYHGACLQELVTDPAHFIPNLLRNLNDSVFLDTWPCASTAVLHAHCTYGCC